MFKRNNAHDGTIRIADKCLPNCFFQRSSERFMMMNFVQSRLLRAHFNIMVKKVLHSIKFQTTSSAITIKRVYRLLHAFMLNADSTNNWALNWTQIFQSWSNAAQLKDSFTTIHSHLHPEYLKCPVIDICFFTQGCPWCIWRPHTPTLIIYMDTVSAFTPILGATTSGHPILPVCTVKEKCTHNFQQSPTRPDKSVASLSVSIVLFQMRLKLKTPCTLEIGLCKSVVLNYSKGKPKSAHIQANSTIIELYQ